MSERRGKRQRRNQGVVQHSDELTRWAYTSLYARDDAYPAWSKKTGDWRCVHEDLTEAVARDHFHGRQTIGTYPPLGRDGRCLWVGWDIDRHDGEPGATRGEPAIRLHALSSDWFAWERTRSWRTPTGRAGVHVWLRFAKRSCPVSLAYSVAAWLTAGLPEEDPRRSVSQAAGPERDPQVRQQQMRLPGKHHKRDHWSRSGTGEVVGRGGGVPSAAGLPGDRRLGLPATGKGVCPHVPEEADIRHQTRGRGHGRSGHSGTTIPCQGSRHAERSGAGTATGVPSGDVRRPWVRPAQRDRNGSAEGMGRKMDQTDEHGGYYRLTKKEIEDLVRWAEGQSIAAWRRQSSAYRTRAGQRYRGGNREVGGREATGSRGDATRIGNARRLGDHAQAVPKRTADE